MNGRRRGIFSRAHTAHTRTRAMQCKQSTHQQQQQQQVIERGKRGRGKEKKKKSTQRENVESGEGRRGERREQTARERPRKKESKHEPTTSAGRGVRRMGRPIFSPFSAEDEEPDPETTHERIKKTTDGRTNEEKQSTNQPQKKAAGFLFLFSFFFFFLRFLALSSLGRGAFSSFFFLLPACSSPFVCGSTTD